MYRYETHMHTAPASKCAEIDVRRNLLFYKSLHYDGVFITNHFLDGNIGGDRSLPYDDQLNFFLADYEQSKIVGAEIGLKVFFGVEISLHGTDFLIYGLDGDWYRVHPEIMAMKKSQELPFMRDAGAFIIQAHPFRESGHIDHIRLFPRCVEGVEVINANRTPFENHMAEIYAAEYGLLRFAGSDNHKGPNQVKLAGMECQTPLESERDLIDRMRAGEMYTFFEERTERRTL